MYYLVSLLKFKNKFSLDYNYIYTTLLFFGNSIYRPIFKIYNAMLVNKHTNKPFWTMQHKIILTL